MRKRYEKLLKCKTFWQQEKMLKFAVFALILLMAPRRRMQYLVGIYIAADVGKLISPHRLLGRNVYCYGALIHIVKLLLTESRLIYSLATKIKRNMHTFWSTLIKTERILVNSKPCPNCKTAIEKIDGCMHMICLPPCEYHFCWMCLGPWSDHPSRHGGFYACNIHTEQENMGLYEEHERNVRMAKSSLERYPKYYKQWQAKHSFLARNAITLHSRYAEYVKICFNNHYIFDKAFSEVMEEFCNNAKNAMGKSLVIFCSKLLEKDGSEKLIDGNIEKTLEKAVHLLSFFRNKDFYAKFYRQTLARRLLFGLSANEEHEIFILTKLKKHFGWHFTCRMERMILDRSLSKELQKAYDKYLSGNPPADPGINLTVNVLTKGIWPVFPAYDLRLPTELVKCAEVYTQHYNSTMTRRKISWMNSLGTCTIRVNWEGETRELVVTACQASLLWLFNNNERLNYSEIAAGLNFKGDVISLLYSLIHEDFNILKKIPPSDFISSTDSFEFNGHFSDKRENMMITFRGIERGNNAQDWSDTIDACIMRVMKQAQILESDELMMICAAELSRMLKFYSSIRGHLGFRWQI